MIDFINSWRSGKKQNDKFGINIRAGKITILLVGYDHSDRNFKIMVMNYGVVIGKKQEA